MHIFLDNFHQGRKYTAQIAIHQVEQRRVETFTDQKYSSISFLQNDYLKLGRSSGSGGKNEREILVQKNSLFVEMLTILQ